MVKKPYNNLGTPDLGTLAYIGVFASHLLRPTSASDLSYSSIHGSALFFPLVNTFIFTHSALLIKKDDFRVTWLIEEEERENKPSHLPSRGKNPGPKHPVGTSRIYLYKESTK